MTGRIVHTTVSDDFPADTPVSLMTDAQAAAYWKSRARKHERRAERWDDPAAVRARHEELNPDRTEKIVQLTEDEQARQHAENDAWHREQKDRTEQRRASLALAIAAATGRTGPALDVIVNRLDPDTFVNDAGELDTDAVTDFTGMLSHTRH